MEKEMTYQIEELLNNTYRIDESGTANCYLVIGDKKALLIDSCWGSGDLKGCVAQLTDKPVIVTMTHRHPDHTFGARQFGDYYVSEKDNILFNRVLDSQLMGRLSQKANTKLWVKRSKPLPLKDGHIFCLGNRDVEVVSIPGHTAGSVMYIDHANKLLFTGDNMNPHLWMHRTGAVSLEEWKTGAKKILTYMESGYSIHTGHGNGTLSMEQAETIYCHVHAIIKKAKSGQLTKDDSPYPEKGGFIEIQFDIKKVVN